MFSKRLKLLRLSKKLSQQHMADLLGITRQGYAKYESSKSSPDLDTLDKLANYFNVSTDYILGRIDNVEITDGEKNFIKDIEKLSLSELEDKHLLTVDGKPATKEEIEATVAFIRSLRNLKQ